MMRFQRKVSLLLLTANLGTVLALSAVVYTRMFREQREALRNRVIGIASTAALSIDGDFHSLIPPDPSAIQLPAYQQLQSQLRQVLAANPGLRYVWTMVKSRTPGETLFVGDVGGSTPQPGRRYQATGIPDLWAGFNAPSADRQDVRDPWGVSISGYAPIRNRSGQGVALLGVDVYDQQLFLLRQRFLRFLAFSLAFAALMGLVTGGWVARRIARPLDRLVQGMHRVESGDLRHSVHLRTADEFEEAAAAFNRMTHALRASRDELRAAFLKTIQSLTSALEAKDPYTRGHSSSVTQFATEIARALGKSTPEIEILSRLAILHDIGKIGVHDATLLKPSSLTPEERSSMQEHPSIGARILASLDLSEEELALILHHHEREDGSGYPRGLDRTKISDLVAIVSVADAYDAMISHRPYRQARKPAEALVELRRCAGTQFRPEAVEALAIVLEKNGCL